MKRFHEIPPCVLLAALLSRVKHWKAAEEGRSPTLTDVQHEMHPSSLLGLKLWLGALAEQLGVYTLAWWEYHHAEKATQSSLNPVAARSVATPIPIALCAYSPSTAGRKQDSNASPNQSRSPWMSQSAACAPARSSLPCPSLAAECMNTHRAGSSSAATRARVSRPMTPPSPASARGGKSRRPPRPRRREERARASWWTDARPVACVA